MSRLQPARGTSDLLPDAMAAHRQVVTTAREASARYGFQEMATPIFEFAEVFSRPLGDSSDVVTKETYNFTDRGGETFTLRPENTAGVVRAMISNGLTQSLPLKFFYAGPMFRYERPQKGRMRQFHQIGIEFLGPRDGLADAEIIACGARVLSDLGVLDKCKLHLNSLGDTDSRQAYRSALVAFLERHAGDLSEDSQARLKTNPLRILDSKNAGDRDILVDAPRLDAHLNAESAAHFKAVTTALDAAGINWEFDPLLVRGLDYYCHTAFEFITDALGAQGTVLGGGRYDGLSEMLGGPPVAGVGWAAGIERLAMLAGDAPVDMPRVAVMSAEEDADSTAFALAEALRTAGIAVDLPTGGNIGKRMKKADRAGIRYAVILGGAELASGTVQLRDLGEGAQEEVAQADLVARLLQNPGNEDAS
ncbi:MAG: histidine--tRNA ligase [Alphaproteobacteria bacterium]|nr:histidine--tRNA ligase [Alphaproteobacteria bacterium]